MIHKTILLVIFIVFSLRAQTTNERNDLKKYFDEYNHVKRRVGMSSTLEGEESKPILSKIS